MSNLDASKGHFAEVSTLLSNWAAFADRADVAGLCDMFCEDGRLSVGDAVHAGRDAIAAFLAERMKSTRLIRHLWGNLRIDGFDSNELRCVSTQITFEQAGDRSTTQIRVSDISDVLRCEPGAPWRIALRSIVHAMDFTIPALHRTGLR